MARRRSLGDRLSRTPLLAVAVCLLASGFAPAVPAADGLRAAATPEARLFTQSSARATLTPTKCECDGRSVLTLRDVSPHTARFSDEPKPHAGHIGTRNFTRAWSRCSTSVFAAMRARHGTTVKRAETAFSAAVANPDEAGRLEVPVGSALLEVRGFNADQEGRVVASFRHRIRGDRAEYVVRLPQ